METLFDASYGVSVGILSTPGEVEALLCLFAEVAQQQPWQTADALQTCSEHSVYLALKIGEALAGGLQLVRPDPSSSLPLQQVWPEIDLPNRQDVAQVASLALQPQRRSKARLFWLLCTELWRYCIHSGINELWLVVPTQTRRRYWKRSWPLAIRGPLRKHGREYSYPCSLDLRKVAEAVQRNARRSPLYRRLVAQGSRRPPGSAAGQDSGTCMLLPNLVTTAHNNPPEPGSITATHPSRFLTSDTSLLSEVRNRRPNREIGEKVLQKCPRE
jgi:hypothetical protein